MESDASKAAALERSAHPDLTFAITRKDNGRVIGEIFFRTGGYRAGAAAIPDTYSLLLDACARLPRLRLHAGSRHAYFDYLLRRKERDASISATEED